MNNNFSPFNGNFKTDVSFLRYYHKNTFRPLLLLQERDRDIISNYKGSRYRTANNTPQLKMVNIKNTFSCIFSYNIEIRIRQNENKDTPNMPYCFQYEKSLKVKISLKQQ